MTAPADLAAQMIFSRDRLRDMREVTADLLNRTYAGLDAATLTRDILGHPLTAEQALTEVHEALAGLDRALAIADHAVTDLLSYTGREL
ncbi:MAG: hypothetical protein ACRDRY_19520 [Pseudonocardiaceae bacterium]|jgi:hypothetical protein